MTSGLRPKRIYWSLVLVFLLFSMAIGVAGYFFYENQKKIFQQEKRDQLGAISDLKVRQITNWRQERIEDGAMIFRNPFIAQPIQQWFQNPKAAGIEKEILDWMASLQKPLHYQSYASVLLLDPKGVIRLSVPEGEKSLDPFSKTLAIETAHSKELTLSDLYRDETRNVILLSLLVPILIQKGDAQVVVAVVLLRIDAQQFLYPLIQSWPTPSLTSETLLIRRETEEVVYLNELRHRKNTALAFRLPISKQDLPAARAARGQEGVGEGIDYRGQPVLAALRQIPGTPWALVAKVDQEEIYGPIRLEARLITVLVGVLMIGVATSVGFLWRGQHFQEHKRSDEEIRRLNEGLKGRTLELEHANKELETFSYSVSHDLRTPLVAIGSLSNILLQRHSADLDEKGRKFLVLIQKETQKLLQFIEDLMAFSRLERQEVQQIGIDMGEMARSIFDEFKQIVSERRLQFEIKALPPACVDKAMVRQVLYNLFSNAIKFTKAKDPAVIKIGGRTEHDENVYYVKDNGVGFDMKYVGKLFNTFERLHSGEEFEGTGIGLAIVQRIIQRHGGRVWAEGKVNEGATFYFTLPKCPV